jgi:hypothetical protein
MVSHWHLKLLLSLRKIICPNPAIKHIKERETNDISSNSPQAKDEQNNSLSELTLHTSMDSFFTLFPESETPSEPSTPIDADGGNNNYCVVA